jgi:hypothetical protein
VTDYAKLGLRFVYSKNSDYSDPDVDPDFSAVETTPSDVLARSLTVTSGGVAVDLAGFSSVSYAIIRNKSSSYSVTVTFNNAAASAQSLVLASGKPPLIITDIQVAGDITLTAASSDCECDVYVVGS